MSRIRLPSAATGGRRCACGGCIVVSIAASFLCIRRSTCRLCEPTTYVFYDIEHSRPRVGQLRAGSQITREKIWVRFGNVSKPRLCSTTHHLSTFVFTPI